MDGAASDLRTGLPWQMVEIHEPVRLLNIIETTPEAMLQIMERNPGIGRLCRNGWVHLAVLDPETREVKVFQDGRFQRLPAPGRPRCPRPLLRWTGIAAGATIWSLPRSQPPPTDNRQKPGPNASSLDEHSFGGVLLLP